MATIASKIGDIIPEGKLKNLIRFIAFRFLFITIGSRTVKIGPPSDKIAVRIKNLPFTPESMGEREIVGYLKCYQPQPGDIIINAGAYHGYFALYLAAKVGPRGQVICLEPEPNNLRILHKNLALNKFKNVTILPQGLWNLTTTLPITSRGSGSRLDPNSKSNIQSVAVTTLDDLVKQLNLTQINLITMDIEGAEIAACDGIKELVINYPEVNFAIASYHIVDGQPTHHVLEKKLSHLGLKVWTEYPPHLTTYAAFK